MWRHSVGNIGKGCFNFSLAVVAFLNCADAHVYSDIIQSMWALDNLEGKATLDNGG